MIYVIRKTKDLQWCSSADWCDLPLCWFLWRRSAWPGQSCSWSGGSGTLNSQIHRNWQHRFPVEAENTCNISHRRCHSGAWLQQEHWTVSSWTDLRAKNKQTCCRYSNCCHSNLPPCRSWWWGRLRWAAGFEHLPLWRGLWGLSRWKRSSTPSPRRWHGHLGETWTLQVSS